MNYADAFSEILHQIVEEYAFTFDEFDEGGDVVQEFWYFSRHIDTV